MSGKWESDTKMNVARNMLKQMLDSLKNVENVELALRVYGHQSYVPPQDCNDTRLEVPFEKNNIDKIKHKLNQLQSRGTTPIAHSLFLCGEDFPDEKSNNIIILITDGIEACDGDPCAVSRELQKKGIILKPFIIGIGLDEDLKKTFECVGHFYDASNEKQLNDVLKIVISQALNNTTAQVNLLDYRKHPTETNVAMTFYNQKNGAVVHNYIHTLNAFGFPDTLVLDPFTTFKMVVHTIPPVEVDSIKVKVGKHNIIPAYVPQGGLIIESKDEHIRPNIVLREHNKKSILHVMDINREERLLVGNYDLNILTLPRINLDSVSIDPDKTTTISIPSTALVTLSHRSQGYGSLFYMRGDKQEWIYNLNPNRKNERLYLLPGNYTLVYRSKGAYESVYTITKTFKVISNRSQTIQIDYNY